jgi:hypothetical protein
VGRRLTAWAMARPGRCGLFDELQFWEAIW